MRMLCQYSVSTENEMPSVTDCPPEYKKLTSFQPLVYLRRNISAEGKFTNCIFAVISLLARHPATRRFFGPGTAPAKPQVGEAVALLVAPFKRSIVRFRFSSIREPPPSVYLPSSS